MICFNITGKEIENYLQSNIQPGHSVHSPVTLQKLPRHILLEELFTSIKLCMEQNYLLDSKLTCIKLQECIYILTLIDKGISYTLFTFGKYPRRNLRQFMESNYMFNTSLKQFAEFSGRSLSTFRREFLKEFGLSPTRWLINKRLEVAWIKIREEGKKPSELYWELVFETQPHFTRCFKAKYGVTPGKLYKE